MSFFLYIYIYIIMNIYKLDEAWNNQWKEENSDDEYDNKSDKVENNQIIDLGFFNVLLIFINEYLFLTIISLSCFILLLIFFIKY